jgi:hypothetical protein
VMRAIAVGKDRRAEGEPIDRSLYRYAAVAPKRPLGVERQINLGPRSASAAR